MKLFHGIKVLSMVLCLGILCGCARGENGQSMDDATTTADPSTDAVQTTGGTEVTASLSADDLEPTAGLRYTKREDGTYEVSRIGELSAERLVIPAVAEDGTPVTAVAAGAFSTCDEITSIWIQSGIVRIETSAFEACSNVTEIHLPDSVTYIGDYAFRGCTKITEIDLPAGVTYLGVYAFAECYLLERFEVPAAAAEIGNYLLADCRALTSLTVAEGNSFYRAAQNCLIEIERGRLIAAARGATIPDDGSVRILGPDVFRGFDMVTVVVPEGVTSIGQGAFKECDKLQRITLPRSLEVVALGAFDGCEALDEVFYNGSILDWIEIKNGGSNGAIFDRDPKFGILIE